MKRVLCSVVIFAILITNTALYVNAKADDENTVALPQLACQLFPEYADKIQGITNSNRSSRSGSQSCDLIFSETRSTPENHSITYSEYEDGLVTLTSVEPVFSYSTSTNSSETSGSYTTTSVNITVWVVDSDVGLSYDTARFELRNVIYTINRSGYDRIDSVGVERAYGTNNNLTCKIHTRYTPIMTETASSKATIQYHLTWKYTPNEYYTYPSLFTFRVGQNGAGVTHELF